MALKRTAKKKKKNGDAVRLGKLGAAARLKKLGRKGLAEANRRAVQERWLNRKEKG